MTQTSDKERSCLYQPLLITIFSPPFLLDCAHVSPSEVLSSVTIATGQKLPLQHLQAYQCENCGSNHSVLDTMRALLGARQAVHPGPYPCALCHHCQMLTTSSFCRG